MIQEGMPLEITPRFKDWKVFVGCCPECKKDLKFDGTNGWLPLVKGIEAKEVDRFWIFPSGIQVDPYLWTHRCTECGQYFYSCRSFAAPQYQPT